MDFGEAIKALKLGSRVAREGWNGKGMWLQLVQSHPCDKLGANILTTETYHLAEGDKSIEGFDESLHAGQMLSFIMMKTAGDSKYWGTGKSDFIPWLASQMDVLAEDWLIVVN